MIFAGTRHLVTRADAVFDRNRPRPAGNIMLCRSPHIHDVVDSRTFRSRQRPRASGQVSEEAPQNARRAGYHDAEVIEIVLHVTLNTLTTYVKDVATPTSRDPRT